MKRDFPNTTNLSDFKYFIVLILNYGHESWVMNEKLVSQVHAADMEFLCRLDNVTFSGKMHSCEIRIP